MWLDFDVRENIIMLLWIMDSYFSQKQWFEVKNVLKTDLFQLLSSPDVNWWTVDYCDVFIRLSFWRHPFTAEHPLLRHWCNATFLQIWWNVLDDLRVSKCTFSGWTIPLRLYSSLFHSSFLWCLCSSRQGGSAHGHAVTHLSASRLQQRHPSVFTSLPVRCSQSRGGLAGRWWKRGELCGSLWQFEFVLFHLYLFVYI